ncbi:phosphotransferase family protein [Litoribacillus peritrichatus]|uniref:Phosphotransferase family protein n=1 Tax=Litoribacillus peritrichatus TaxID=718191 RepID=A0ABP7MCY4_9GAMM
MSMESINDQPTAVRDGEELDVAKVDAYLKSSLDGLIGTPTVRQFPGGASNLTYLLSYENTDLILRRPPFGTIAKSAHDMLREAHIIDSLKPVYDYVPGIVSICEDRSVLGCDFYVMERLEGIIPRQDLPKGLKLSEADTRKLCLNVIDRLIALHQIDPQGTQLEQFGKGEGYVERQIKGWSDRYRKAMTDDASGFEEVMAWLSENQPQDIANCLIHNDYRFDNVVLNPDNPFDVIGVLDWEMATLGDPLMDLGNTLAYWVEAGDDPQMQFMRRQPTHLKGMLTRKEVVDYYLDKTGYQVTNFDFYEIYGLFRLAVIIQQIYYRYYHGQTKDKRFANFIHAANYLETRCMKLISEHSDS